jgi:hypothetical protein
MTTSVRPIVYINQFRQSVAPGEVDFQITRSGVFTAILSPNQTTPLVAGARVTLDTANTNATMPQVLGAADGTDGIGVIVKTVKQGIASPNLGGAGTPGDIVEVAYFFGPVVWQVANATIQPGQQLECATVTIAGQAYPFYQPIASNKLAGLALDPAVQNGIFRMFVLSGLVVGA